jgi:myo-inositol-1-phosphate synthase
MATRNKSAKTASKVSRIEVQSERKARGGFRPNGTIEPAKGKLGVMIPGMGAVATTFVAGVEAIRKGLAKPIGSYADGHCAPG